VKRGSAVLLGGITLLGALLRIWSPGRIGLSGDEVLFLNVSALPGYRAIVAFLYSHESHPPLYYFLGHLAASLWGDTAGAMATLSVLASIGAIPAAWWLASLSGRRGAGAVAGALVALSVPLAALGVQIRPYSIFTVLLLCSTGLLIQADRRPNAGWKALWAGIMLILLYLHHLAVFAFASHVVALSWLALRGESAVSKLRAWLPWVAAVMLLAVPDMLMLTHQHTVTGYAPVSGLKPLLPFADLARLALTFPGELLLALMASATAVVAVWRSEAAGRGNDVSVVLGVVSLTFMLQCLLLTAASYRQSVLVSHLMLPFTPLGLAATGILLGDAFASQRRVASFLWSEVAVVCVTLSTVFSIGWTKANLDLIARYIDAEALPGDLVLLIPGPFGGVVTRNLDAPVSRIDFPEIGSPSVYSFDHHLARVLDTTTLAKSVDSITTASNGGRRIWFIFPTKWVLDTGRKQLSARPSEVDGFRNRTNALREVLRHNFGLPVATSVPERSWNMEALTVELFRKPAGGMP
jgi:hypothetical protein